LAERSDIVAWVGRQILPHEGEVRAWLRRSNLPTHEVDDVVQEAYCKLAGLEAVGHIQNPRAYFFQTARTIVLMQARRARIVRIDTIGEIDALNILDERPNPEEEVTAFRDLQRLRALIDTLPEKCRRVFIMRKIEDIPQKEIARRLGITENTVEVHVTKGLQLILKAWAQGASGSRTISRAKKDAGEGNRKRD
jgi:RNA polymerase sigma-70 factor (ECF subfamily)